MAYDETTVRELGNQGDARAGGVRTDDRARLRDGEELLDTGTGPMPGGRGDGRDRLGVHIGWEIVLLLGVVVLGYLLYRLDPASIHRPGRDVLLVQGAVIGLLTLGAGVTLRAGVPNLAVGPIALAAAMQYAEQGDHGLLRSAVPALLIAAAGGLVVGLVVLILQVPGWVATLAASFGVIVFVQMRTGPVAVQGAFDPARFAPWLFGAFAALAVFGGVVGAIGGIRRLLGRMRPVSDPAERRGVAAALPVLGSLILSSVLAAGAGVLLSAQSTQPITPATGLDWTGIAFGTALLAGTSAYGRRGGIFGTVLAVSAMALFMDYSERRNLDVAPFAVAAAAIAVGLIVTRLVETFGRPLPVGKEDDWSEAPSTGPASWSPEMPDPVDAPPKPVHQWDDGPWGSAR